MELYSFKTIAILAMLLKAKLETSCSPTICINEVFAKSLWIRSTNDLKLLYQSAPPQPEPAPRVRVVADRPKAMAAVWPTCAVATPTAIALACPRVKTRCYYLPFTHLCPSSLCSPSSSGNSSARHRHHRHAPPSCSHAVLTAPPPNPSCP